MSSNIYDGVFSYIIKEIKDLQSKLTKSIELNEELISDMIQDVDGFEDEEKMEFMFKINQYKQRLKEMK